MDRFLLIYWGIAIFACGNEAPGRVCEGRIIRPGEYVRMKNIVMKELVAQIKEQIAAFTENADLQVEKNNKAAGTRARKAALELSKLLKDFRKVSVEEAKK